MATKNSHYSCKSENENLKLDLARLKGNLEGKDKAYNDLRSQISDMQFQMDRLRRTQEADLSTPTYSIKQSSNLYESPLGNLNSFSGFSSSLKGTNDILNVPSKEINLAGEVTKVEIKTPLTQTEAPVFKSKSDNEKFSSNAVGSVLGWGDSVNNGNNSNNNQLSSGRQINFNQSQEGGFDKGKDAINNLIQIVPKFNSKMEELQHNMSEEERLTKLIRDPPMQYRKHKMQQQLKEDLKKAQRKIYELKFEISKNP